ncbi:MAG TPA: SDR family oxidoreductase [Limnobacter sp.]|nr:SDR family oxidoreductase [Limnobacter sp.]
MNIQNAVVFITGANRGLGKAIAQEALERGAKKVYAASRELERINLPGVIPVKLDVTNANDIEAAAQACSDVNVLINNAGVAAPVGFLDEGAVDATRWMLEANFFGPLRLTRAFKPALLQNGPSAVLNVLSVLSWMAPKPLSVYGASKSAAWGLTNGLRNELSNSSILVSGLHVGLIDTDLTRGFDAPKLSTSAVAKSAWDGLLAGLPEILVDEMSAQVKQGLSVEQAVYLHAAAMA